MVGKWGMSDAVGPMAYLRGADSFLGGQDAYRSFSEETSRLVDQEIRKLIEDCYHDAMELLEKEKSFLEQVSEALLASETLDREELEIIYSCSLRKAASISEKSEQ